MITFSIGRVENFCMASAIKIVIAIANEGFIRRLPLCKVVACSADRFEMFPERDRIVRERDSMRIMCDRLRQDRDNTVNELIKAKKESDEMKKQRNQAVSDLKSFQWVFFSILI